MTHNDARYTFVATASDGTGFAHVVPEEARRFFGEVWAQGASQGMGTRALTSDKLLSSIMDFLFG